MCRMKQLFGGTTGRTSEVAWKWEDSRFCMFRALCARGYVYFLRLSF